MLIMDRHSMMWIGVCLLIMWIASVVNGQITEATGGGNKLSIFAQAPKDIPVQGGQDVTFTCTFIATGSRWLTRHRWFKDADLDQLNSSSYFFTNNNKLLDYRVVDSHSNASPVNGTKCSACSVTPGHNFSSLTLHHIQPKDEGAYICHLVKFYTPPLYVYDVFNLSVEVHPSVLISTGIKKPVEEGETVPITCRSSSVYPPPEKLQILLNGTVIHTITSPNPTSTNSDGSFRVNTTYELIVNRTHNNTNVSCRAMVNNKPYNSTASEPLKVVWPPVPPNPEDFSVQGEPGACLVEWDKFDNADNVTICHQIPDEVDMSTCETFNQVQGSNHNKEIGQSIAVEKNYNVWVYISNRLGNSGNSSAKQCKNLKSRGTSTGSSISVMAGAGGGALVLLLIIAVTVIVVVVRRTKRTNNYEEDSKELKELYSDVVKPPNPPGGGRSATPVSAPPQDVQYATVPGPQIPQKSDELQRELDGQDPYDVVHMKQPTIVPQPKLPKKDKDINGNKKTSKEKPRARQNGVGNPNAPGNHVTTPPESHTIPPSSNSHVTPPPPSTNSHVTTPPTANSRVTAPPRSQKKASHVTPPPPANEYGDTTTYARVAIQPQTPGKKPPPPQPRVENTEYFAVQFHPVPKNGIPKEDEDSD